MISKYFQLVERNGKVLIAFELLLKLLTVFAVFPLLWGMFQFLMYITGHYYLTLENIASFASNPLTILLLLLFLFLIAFLFLAEMSGIVYILDSSRRNRDVTLKIVFLAVCNNIYRAFHRKNIGILGVVLVMVPMMSIGIIAGYLGTFKIPRSLIRFLQSNLLVVAFVAAVLLLIVCISLRWMYTVCYFTLEGISTREAVKKSRVHGKGRWLQDFLAILGIQAACEIVYILISIVGILGAVLLGKGFERIHIPFFQINTMVWAFLRSGLFLVSVFIMPLSYISIADRFFLYKSNRKESLQSREPVKVILGERGKRNRAIILTVLFLIWSACVGAYLYRNNQGDTEIQIEYLQTMEVTAHRGASKYYPENTMAAFQGAVELGADWIELDVQQSRDGQIYVMHDANLGRTTGVWKKAWEMDYDEIAKLDAGSHFSPEFAGEKVPLLSEVIDFAKENGAHLNIELKPTGHETRFEEMVVDLIREEEFENECVITSQVYRSLEKVKAYDENIKTVYVMGLAYGNVNRLTAADDFSIQSGNVTERLVSRVHNAGKKLYVWTVNNKGKIRRMIDLKVDNLITDNVTLAKNCIYERKISSLVMEYVTFLMDL